MTHAGRVTQAGVSYALLAPFPWRYETAACWTEGCLQDAATLRNLTCLEELVSVSNWEATLLLGP